MGQPKKVVPAAAVASEGHRPGSLFPTAAEHENSQQFNITSWIVDWLALGSSAGAANAHPLETDSAGGTQVQRLTIADLVDEVALTVAASNTIAPAVLITSSGTFPALVQADTGATDQTGFTATGSGGSPILYDGSLFGSSGTIWHGTVDSTSSGVPFVISNDGTGDTAQFYSNRLGGTVGVYMEAQRGVCLTLNAIGPLGTSLRLIPRAGAAATSGALWIENTENWINYYDTTPTRKRVWASSSGFVLSPNAFTTGTSTIAATTTVQTFNYTFTAGQRYRITMSCRLGRAAGSTQNATIGASVGGVNLDYNGHTVQLFQAGAAGQLEQTWIGDCVFTAGVSGLLAVQLQITPAGGAGSVNVAQRSIVVAGGHD